MRKAIWLTIIFVSMATLIFYFCKISTNIRLNIDSEQNGIFQIFWAKKNQVYAEIRSVSLPFGSGKTDLSFVLPSWDGIEKIRIDPINKEARITLSDIIVKRWIFTVCRLDTTDMMAQLKPNQHIGSLEFSDRGFQISTKGSDPQIEVQIFDGKKVAAIGKFLLAASIVSIITILFSTGVKNLLAKFSCLKNPKEIAQAVVVWFISTSCLTWLFFLYTSKTDFYVKISSDQKGIFQIYWAENNQGYRENRSKATPIQRGNQNLYLKLGDLNAVDRFRIDPIASPASIRLMEIRIKHPWYETIFFRSVEDFEKIKPVGYIGHIDYLSDGLRFTTTGNDPQLELFLDPTPNGLKNKIYTSVILFTAILLMGHLTGYTNRFNVYLRTNRWSQHVSFTGELFFLIICFLFFFKYSVHQLDHTVSFLKELIAEFSR